MAILHSIHRYPIKSTRSNDLREALVEPRGIASRSVRSTSRITELWTSGLPSRIEPLEARELRVAVALAVAWGAAFAHLGHARPRPLAGSSSCSWPWRESEAQRMRYDDAQMVRGWSPACVRAVG